MTREDYLLLAEKQNNKCAACGGPPNRMSFCVDHDHETGRIRGLLCTNCNLALGNVKDNLDNALGFVRYIKNFC